MADNRYFRVEKDTSLPKAYRAVRDNSGTVYDYETEGIAYDAGQVVNADNIDPRVVERLDDGDEHLNSLLSEVSEKEAQEYNEGVREANKLVRLPEHTVEAHKLASDPDEPYTLLSVEEGVELTSLGLEEAKEAQEAAREESGDDLDAEQEFEAIDFAAAKGELDKDAGSEPVTPSDVAKEVKSSSKKSSKSKKSGTDVKKAADEGKVEASNATQAGNLAKNDK